MPIKYVPSKLVANICEDTSERLSPIVVYCDGSSDKDNYGGWAYTAYDGVVKYGEYGGSFNTTNNKMELWAAYKALASINVTSVQVCGFCGRQEYIVSTPLNSSHKSVCKICDSTSVEMHLLGIRPVHIHTDSQYVIGCATLWYKNWMKNGWETVDGEPVKNKYQIQELVDVAERHKVSWCKVKGHSGNAGNEEVDKLANLGRLNIRGM